MYINRPFSIVEGDGFKALAEKLISIGAAYGKVDIDHVLPCSTTVSRHLDGVVEREKTNLINKLARVPPFGVTTDLWTHSHSSHSYITVTIQYIENWNVRSHILATRVMDDKHTGETVKVIVKSIMEEFGAVRANNVFVTDNASNMKAAFREYTWVGCACHNLNLVLSHGLSVDKSAAVNNHNEDEPSGVPAEVVQLIDICKEIVTLAKRTKINTKLDKTLKQCVVTRWNSTLTTMKSVAENVQDLHTISTEAGVNRNLLRLLADLNEDLLTDVINVLTPFDTATKCLSTDKSPSLHLVLPTKFQLSKHLSPLASDNGIISQLKKHLNDKLQRHYPIQQLHFTATLLDPGLKNNFTVIPPENHAAAVDSLRQLVDNIPIDQIQSVPALSTDSSSPPRKKAKPHDSFYNDLYDRSSTSDQNEVSFSLMVTILL